MPARLRSLPARILPLGLGLLLVMAVPPAQAQPADKRNSIGAGVSYRSPDSPLDGAAGAMLRYTRTFAFARKASAQPWMFKGEVGSFTLDREADSPPGTAQEGKVDLLQVSAALLRRFGTAGGNWSFAVGLGADYFSPDAEGTFRVTGPIGIENNYEADSAVGFHGEFGIALALGSRWQLFGSLGYLAAELDGTHRYVIDNVQGTPTSVKIDLGGPTADLGVAFRF